MQYKATNVQQKTSSKGTVYYTADMVNIVDNQMFNNASSFSALVEGQVYDGEIVQNGQYLNFKPTSQVKTGGKSGQMEKVMEKKQEAITQSQDRKEHAVATAGSITNATNLLVAVLNHSKLSNMITNEVEMKAKLREYIVFYKTMYEHPHEIPSQSEDIPF